MVIIVISLDLAILEMTIPLPSFSVEHISSKRCKRDLDAFMQSFEVDTKPGRHQQTCYCLANSLPLVCHRLLYFVCSVTILLLCLIALLNICIRKGDSNASFHETLAVCFRYSFSPALVPHF